VSHEQNATTFQPYVFVTGIRRLLVTSKGRSAFYSADHYQGQQQNQKSLYVGVNERKSKAVAF